jgi:hypothetical protein
VESEGQRSMSQWGMKTAADSRIRGIAWQRRLSGLLSLTTHLLHHLNMASTSTSTTVIPSAASTSSSSARIASHSHIRGLGVDAEGNALDDLGVMDGGSGMVGQRQAREVSKNRS